MHAASARDAVEIRASRPMDRASTTALAREVLGDEFQAMSRRQFNVADLPAHLALRGEELLGMAAWEIDGSVCEVLAICCRERDAGVGTQLMRAVQEHAARAGCSTMRVVTTEENLGARRFYERLGYVLVQRRIGAVDECRRRYKPSIPPGIHDELEYERAR